MKQTYIRCPRCELNYILKKDKYCNVCKAEMKAVGNMGTDEDMDLELCPICKTNYINADEDICPACAKEREEEEEDAVPTSVWDTYTSPDDDEGYNDDEDSDMVSITGLDDNPLDDDSLDLGLDDEDEQEDLDDESSEPDELDEDFDDIGDDEDADGDDDDEEEEEDDDE